MGVSWEPSWASCGSLGRSLDPKMLENCGFFKGFEKAVFWSLKLLMALLGSSCCFLGKSGPKMGFKMGIKSGFLRHQKMTLTVFSNKHPLKKFVKIG